MGQEPTAWDYLFVSDLHLSLGYDPERRTYHPREDFFFDEAFFRWLRWADGTRAPGRRWELVLIGDVFDFLPVDEAIHTAYIQEQDRRHQEGVLDTPEQAVQYWLRRFGEPVPKDPIALRVQRLLFEEDLLAGRVHLAPLPPDEAAALAAEPPPIPGWAVRLFEAHYPESAPGVERERLILRPGPPRPLTALGVTPEERPLPTESRPDEPFERRYGFLPTPERSADRMESIYRGHPLFFRSLAWFVGRGHRVVFLRGNHDLELFWPLVQERIREYIAREYPAAFGLDEGTPLPEGFLDRIRFRPGWFYYRRGVFYAEHGNQYESLNACTNPIRPLLPRDDGYLNPPVGSLGVICFHNHLEDRFPEWENRGAYGVVLLELLRRYPIEMIGLLLRHSGDFLRMARRLWRAGQAGDPGPTEEDIARYAEMVGLDPGTVRAIHHEGAVPLLARRLLAWFLFSPAGHVLKGMLLLLLGGLTLGLLGAWYLLVTPALASLIPAGFLSATAGPAVQLLTKLLLWLLPPLLYRALHRRTAGREGEPFLWKAASRLHAHLKGVDPDLRFYIFGHDHRPSARLVERRRDGRHVYYLNTGTWTPVFAEGTRRLRTLGAEVEFTFLRLVRRENGYEADLLRWNDEAGRPEQEVLIGKSNPK